MALRSFSYDVFLSFRGEDTRYGFTGYLYNVLRERGIHTFIDDDEPQEGDEITTALEAAIEKSKIFIIVLSENYASSSCCLNSLTHILNFTKENNDVLVLPVFYRVNPSDVRHHRGSFGEALANHEKKSNSNNMEKLETWKMALHQVSNISGHHFQHDGNKYEYKFIKEIVESVSNKFNHDHLHVSDVLVGLESPVLEVKSLLDVGRDDVVHMVGIHGLAGVGKTTLAIAVYNSIAGHFEASCFLENVKRTSNTINGLEKLQSFLLSKTAGEIKLTNWREGIPIIKRKLKQKKVLLILDDVDEDKQLQALIGSPDWFGLGSRIIITTRDEHLLALHNVKITYKVRELNEKHALQLLTQKAFELEKGIDPSYHDILNRAVTYASGLPFVLEVIGSNLFGKSIEEWKSALDGYERIPHEKIHEIFKVSYDGLEENEKGIFLDIACFLNTFKVSYVTQMLHAHGFHPEDGLRVLVDKSLVKIDASGFVRMHDLIRDTGIEIVRQESTVEPGRRSRLWFKEDIVHVLEENTGTDKIEFIKLEGYNNIQVQWNGKAFQKMKNLRILIIENTTFSTGPEHLPNSLRFLDWSCYPSPSLPSDFNPKRVEILKMPESCLKIFQPHKMLESLSIINFKGCKVLTHLPSLREVPLVTFLCLDYCSNLVKIDCSIGFLDKLLTLSAKGCSKLKILAHCIMLTSLEILDLGDCLCLEGFPEVLVKMEKIREICLDNTAIGTLPFSIGNLVGLELLSLEQCKRLIQLPGSIFTLPKVEVIFGFRHWRYLFFEENQDGKELSLEVFPKAILVCHLDPRHYHHLDLYYLYMSPNNVIQVCSPNLYMLCDFDLLFQKLALGVEKDWFRRCRKWSMNFSFRKKFPKIAVCCSIISRLKSVMEMVLILKFSVLINGTMQFSSSCNYIFRTWDPILWCDLECKAEGIFSEHEWNEAEILFELKCPAPSSVEAMWAHNISMEIIDWTLIGVYNQGNIKDDIKFKMPMSTFLLPNREPPSLPGCLYYVVSHVTDKLVLVVDDGREKDEQEEKIIG